MLVWHSLQTTNILVDIPPLTRFVNVRKIISHVEFCSSGKIKKSLLFRMDSTGDDKNSIENNYRRILVNIFDFLMFFWNSNFFLWNSKKIVFCSESKRNGFPDDSWENYEFQCFSKILRKSENPPQLLMNWKSFSIAFRFKWSIIHVCTSKERGRKKFILINNLKTTNWIFLTPSIFSNNWRIPKKNNIKTLTNMKILHRVQSRSLHWEGMVVTEIANRLFQKPFLLLGRIL